MICPKCGANDDKVLDSRPTDDGFAVRRRRVCLVCGARFSTIEKIEGLKPTVVKKDGSKQLYDPDKIFILQMGDDMETVKSGVLRLFTMPLNFFFVSRNTLESRSGIP